MHMCDMDYYKYQNVKSQTINVGSALAVVRIR